MAAPHRFKPALQRSTGPAGPLVGRCVGPVLLLFKALGGGSYGFGLGPLNVWHLWPPSRVTGRSLHTDCVQSRLEFRHCSLNLQGYLLFLSRAVYAWNHRPWLILWGRTEGEGTEVARISGSVLTACHA